MVGGKRPYHRPIVRILRVSIREGHNDPLFVIWLAMYVLLLDLDTVINFPGVFRGRRGRFMCAVTICGRSVSNVFLDLGVFRTWTYAVRLIQSALRALVLHMYVRGDCNVMIKALEPLTVFRTAHVPPVTHIEVLAQGSRDIYRRFKAREIVEKKIFEAMEEGVMVTLLVSNFQREPVLLIGCSAEDGL